MDPSILIAKLNRKKNKYIPPTGYINGSSKLETKFNLVDHQLVNDFLSSKKEISGFGKEQRIILHKKVDPFADLGSSIFFSSIAVELANIDAIFNITNSKKGNLGSFAPLGALPYLYVALGDKHGIIAQYLQYRKMLTIGYGMSKFNGVKPRDHLNKAIERRDINIYQLEWGNSGNGDLYTDVKSLVLKLRQSHVNGFNLVVSKGRVEEDENFDVTKREINNYRLLLNEFLASIMLLGTGGNLTTLIFGITEIETINLLYIISTCFKEFYIFKPLSSDSTTIESWVIGLKLKLDIKEQITKLTNLSESFSDKLPVKSLPHDFINYIKTTNDFLYTRAIKYIKKIKIYRGKRQEKPQYNTSRLFLAWDIPSFSDW